MLCQSTLKWKFRVLETRKTLLAFSAQDQFRRVIKQNFSHLLRCFLVIGHTHVSKQFFGGGKGGGGVSCMWLIFYITVRLVVKKSRTIFTAPEKMFDVLHSSRYMKYQVSFHTKTLYLPV